MLRLRKPSDAELQRILDASAQATVAYPEAGATRNNELPVGYRIDHYEGRLDAGKHTFARAIAALESWQAQSGAGIRVFPAGARVEEGATVVFVLRAFGIWTVAPCRVVYVTREPDRFSFGYGTLPGHPECGEVAMTVTREGAARIDSFSRTVDPLARAVSPVTRRLQKRVTNRYLDALTVSSGAA